MLLFSLVSEYVVILAKGKGRQSLDWCEFEVEINGNPFTLGGETIGRFVKRFLESVESETGREVGTVPNAKFKDVLGDGSIRYLGCLPFSGYNTLYFFKENLIFHLVTADSTGNLLAHATVSSDVVDGWKEQLNRLV